MNEINGADLTAEELARIIEGWLSRKEPYKWDDFEDSLDSALWAGGFR